MNTFAVGCYYQSSNIGAVIIKITSRTKKTITFESFVAGAKDPFDPSQRRQIKTALSGSEYVVASDIARVCADDICHAPDHNPIEIIVITGEK